MAGAAHAQALACQEPQKPMLEAELFFGRNGGSNRAAVNDARWARFLAEEVTPRFPDGLTVVDGAGQWRNTSHLVREKSKLLIIVVADEAQARERLQAVASAYKQRFRQQSVGIVTRPVCASF